MDGMGEAWACVCLVPFGFTVHFHELLEPVLLRQAAEGATTLVAENEHIRRGLVHHVPSVEDRVHVVRKGVPLDRFRGPVERDAAPRLRLLNVGRLADQKDQATLIAAMSELEALGVDAELRIVGEGPQRERLEAQIADLGLQDRVELMGGIANHRLPDVYRWADVFVLSSRAEGLPVVLAEALASGLPVVTTHVSGIPELVREGIEGHLVPPKDPGALAAGIARLTDPQVRLAMGRRGVERAQMHDLDRTAAALLEAFPIATPTPPGTAHAQAGIRPDPAIAPPIGPPLPVSVVIPAYERPQMLRRALASVAGQRPRLPAEVIVVDDGSGDDTAAVAEEFGVRVIRHERNQGAAAARNTGVRAATQPWVALLDSDDEWLRHHLATLWELRQGHVLVAGSALSAYDDPERDTVIGPDGREPTILRSPAVLYYPWNFIPASGVMVRRDVVLEVGGYRTDLRYAEDFDLWVRVLERGTGIATARVVARYTRHEGQKSQDPEGPRAAQIALLSSYADRSWYEPELLERFRSMAAWRDGRRAMAEGDRGVALAHARYLVARPRRIAALAGLWKLGVVMRRRTSRVARDGGPSAAVVDRDPARRALVAPLVTERGEMRLVTSPSGLRMLLRLTARPTAMAFVGSRAQAIAVRLLGVRPVWADRGENQTPAGRSDGTTAFREVTDPELGKPLDEPTPTPPILASGESRVG